MLREKNLHIYSSKSADAEIATLCAYLAHLIITIIRKNIPLNQILSEFWIILVWVVHLYVYYKKIKTFSQLIFWARDGLDTVSNFLKNVLFTESIFHHIEFLSIRCQRSAKVTCLCGHCPSSTCCVLLVSWLKEAYY